MFNSNSIERDFGKYIKEHSIAVSKLYKCIPDIYNAIELINHCYESKGKVLFFGNGGSAADSQHLAAELVGRYKKNRKAISAIALTTDSSIITAVANDMHFNKIFQRQVEGLANSNDILFAISTSGESINVINAVKAGKKIGCKVVSLTGAKKSLLAKISDVSIKAPSYDVNHIQELHTLIGHFICEIIEKNYK